MFDRFPINSHSSIVDEKERDVIKKKKRKKGRNADSGIITMGRETSEKERERNKIRRVPGVRVCGWDNCYLDGNSPRVS